MAGLSVDVALALRSFELAVALEVGAETVALVGPSGAGKTTVLRCVAGLQRPDRGRIAHEGATWFASERRVGVAPEHRSVGYVFQDYALFPHLRVRANVAFGGAARADALLERFGISHLADARPAAISGGERQRVALARALAREPSVLLLDEPLSALDTHTRLRVRGELAALLADLGLSTLLVTHDFRDALVLADRIGVIAEGRLRQLGTAGELMADPADAYVVAFTGGNLLRGTATPAAGGGARVVLDDGSEIRSAHTRTGRIGVAVYPWEVALTDDAAAAAADGLNVVSGLVGDVTRDGGHLRVSVASLIAESAPGRGPVPARGERAHATFSPAATRLVALDEGR